MHAYHSRPRACHWHIYRGMFLQTHHHLRHEGLGGSSGARPRREIGRPCPEDGRTPPRSWAGPRAEVGRSASAERPVGVLIGGTARQARQQPGCRACGRLCAARVPAAAPAPAAAFRATSARRLRDGLGCGGFLLTPASALRSGAGIATAAIVVGFVHVGLLKRVEVEVRAHSKAGWSPRLERKGYSVGRVRAEGTASSRCLEGLELEARSPEVTVCGRAELPKYPTKRAASRTCAGSCA
jgi:hypothetical protein